MFKINTAKFAELLPPDFLASRGWRLAPRSSAWQVRKSVCNSESPDFQLYLRNCGLMDLRV